MFRKVIKDFIKINRFQRYVKYFNQMIKMVQNNLFNLLII